MKKVFAILLVSVFAFAMVACGDDDDGSSIDNVAACQDAEDAITALECYDDTYPVDMSCDSWGETTCDMVDYWTCYGEIFTCEGDVFTTDTDKATECGEILTELADTCGAE